ncbi:MAG: ATP synthase subunit I [Clostridia bacterium]|nr:ATP synthase subunit I [Clostridia bacterium]
MNKNVTLTETMKIVIGEVFVIVIICAAAALMGKFSLTVLFGALYGSVLNIIYFFLMCLGVNKTVDEENPNKQKATLTASYLVRLLILGAGLVVGFKSAYFNKIALVIPVLMTRPILTLYELFRKEVK